MILFLSTSTIIIPWCANDEYCYRAFNNHERYYLTGNHEHDNELRNKLCEELSLGGIENVKKVGTGTFLG